MFALQFYFAGFEQEQGPEQEQTYEYAYHIQCKRMKVSGCDIFYDRIIGPKNKIGAEYGGVGFGGSGHDVGAKVGKA